MACQLEDRVALITDLTEQELSSFQVIYLFGKDRDLARPFVGLGSHVIWIEDPDAVDIQKMAKEGLFLQAGHFALEERDQEKAFQFFSRLSQEVIVLEMRASEYRDKGKGVFFNQFTNARILPSSILGLSLQNAFCGDIAVVCAAGASLEEEIPFLRALQDKVVVIAGGSAISALQRVGITPHLMTGVDPDPSFDRFLEQVHGTAPFFYQARFSSLQLDLISGTRVWMQDAGSCFCDLLQETLFFDGGWSVANFSVALATFLGFSTIVLAGMDFCALKTKMYASNLPHSPSEELMLPLAGTPFYTRKDWQMSLSWLFEWMSERPEIAWKRMATFNPDLEKGIEHVGDLSSFSSFDVEGKIHALLQQAPRFPISVEQVDSYQTQLKESLEKAHALCENMLHIWSKGHPALPFDKAEYVIAKNDLQGELVYEKILFPVWQIWQYPLLRNELFEPGKQLHELLFFKTTLETYLAEID